MYYYVLSEKLYFPPVEKADDEGLLCVGGDLKPERLLLAYRSGIFPWYNDDVPLWWCPDPRFVLFPHELKISKSMRPLLNGTKYEFRYNTSFREVITACKTTTRKDEAGTWINEDIIEAYCRLHQMGKAVSFECWENHVLIGGLYGVRTGNVFFGESMFSHKTNASKFAFIKAVQQLINEGVVLIDCQIHSSHLESLGAGFISRQDFIEILKSNIDN
ncbi:leucyl/phenylalanyl-tRNA--protein transferase [Polluticaenibacter yanchengensis]|uniref:Leucyl/phenylalanyl-tRNA--protein transferase n=1 Tax=Polluticaenibacter yanchengensis TaxID=3014562 RepID=A0ABT4UF31_9BACT|nr:leucyl/phenylalanyl-tRNA--protein transferase [Chitinophagaceae bacterium LY-5]